MLTHWTDNNNNREMREARFNGGVTKGYIIGLYNLWEGGYNRTRSWFLFPSTNTIIKQRKLRTLTAVQLTGMSSVSRILDSQYLLDLLASLCPYTTTQNPLKCPYTTTQKSVMIAQWDSSLSVLPMARVQFPATAEYFKGFFPGWSHTESFAV